MNWIDTATKVGAIVGSVLGLYAAVTSTIALRLALRKDRREVAAKEPIVHASVSPWGQNRWSVSLSITNRDQHLLGIESVEVIRPKGALISHSTWFTKEDAGRHVIVELENETVPASSEAIQNFILSFEPKDRTPAAVEFRVALVSFGAQEVRRAYNVVRSLA